ncbi:putative uncharacterized protein DDB_G0282133 [Mytilus trossulus]|uniref:putative uncharacterized protein DDB_G0282133 n=1 Tax=Mytilus trossulus TaxID=6551 RepID=UPI003003B326
MASWELTSYFCSAQGVVFIFLHLSDCTFVALLCIERVVKVKNEGFYQTLFEPKWKTAVIAIVVWILNLCIAAIPLSGWIEISYDTYQAACIPKLSRSLYFLVGIFVVSVGILFVVGICIFPCITNAKFEKEKRKSKSNKTNDRTKECNADKLQGTKQDTISNSGETKSYLKSFPKNTRQPESVNTMNPPNGKRKGILIQLKNVTKKSRKIFLENSNDEFQLAVTVFIIWITTILCWLPYYIVTFYDSLHENIWSGFYTITLIGAVLSFFLKPLIYLAHNRHDPDEETCLYTNAKRTTVKSFRKTVNKLDAILFMSPRSHKTGQKHSKKVQAKDNAAKSVDTNDTNISSKPFTGKSGHVVENCENQHNTKDKYNKQNRNTNNDSSNKSHDHRRQSILLVGAVSELSSSDKKLANRGEKSNTNDQNQQATYSKSNENIAHKQSRVAKRRSTHVEYNNKTTDMNGSSNDRKREYNNPSQNTDINGRANDKQMKYDNLRNNQGNVIIEKRSSEQYVGSKTILVQNGGSKYSTEKSKNGVENSHNNYNSKNQFNTEYRNPHKDDSNNFHDYERHATNTKSKENTAHMHIPSRDLKGSTTQIKSDCKPTAMNGSSNDRNMDCNNPNQSTVTNGSSNNRKIEHSISSQSTLLDGRSNKNKKVYNHTSQSIVINESSNDRNNELNNPNHSTVINKSSNDRKKEYNQPSQSIVINESSNDKNNELNNPNHSTVINKSSNDKKKEYNHPSQSIVINESSNDRNNELNNPNHSTVINKSSNDKKKEYNNPGQSIVINESSNDRNNELNNPNHSTVINKSSNDRKKEYNHPSQSIVINESSNDRNNELNNPNHSTVINKSSNDKKKEYNHPSQSILINRSSNDRKNELSNPSQSILINGNSNDKKYELSNPSQSIAMNGSSHERKKEYKNPSKSTDTGDKPSSQQHTRDKTAIAHNHNRKQDSRNNSDKHSDNQLNLGDRNNDAIQTEKRNELTGENMSEKNKLNGMRQITNKHNIPKHSTSNNSTSEDNSEELRDRSGGTNRNKNEVDDKNVQIYNKQEDYKNKQIQMRDQNISNTQKHYKEETREASLKRKQHNEARVDNAEVLFEDDDAAYTSRPRGVQSIEMFRDHEQEKINQKRYTSKEIEQKQIESGTNKMKINKPNTDVNEGKIYEKNETKSMITENENKQQIDIVASKTNPKNTDSSDGAVNIVSSETPKNNQYHNKTGDHHDTHVTASKTKEQYKTDNTEKTNTSHLGVSVVNGKNKINQRTHQLTKATESDMTKSVDDDNRKLDETSSNSNVKISEMSQSDKKDSIHPSNVTETHQTEHMEQNRPTKGKKETTSIEKDHHQTNNSRSIDSYQRNTGYPVNNTSNQMVLSKSVNTSTNRESGISNKTDSSVASNPQSLNQNYYPRNNKYNDIHSKSPHNSQVADLTGDNNEKLKLYDDKYMSKTERGVDKNSTKGISYFSQNNARELNDHFSVGDLPDDNITRKHKLSGTTSNSVDIKQQKSIFQHHGLDKDDHTSLTMLPLKKHSSEMSPDVATVNNTRERITETNTHNYRSLDGFADGKEKYKGNDQQKISFLQGTLAEKSSNELSANKLAYSKYHVNNPQSSRFITANSSDRSSDLTNVRNIQQSKYKGQGPENDSFLSSSFTEQTFNRREENIIRKKDYTVAQIEDTVKTSNSARNVSGSCPYDIPVLYSANDNTTYSTNNAKPPPIKTVHVLQKSTMKRRSIYDALHGDNNHFY